MYILRIIANENKGNENRQKKNQERISWIDERKIIPVTTIRSKSQHDKRFILILFE